MPVRSAFIDRIIVARTRHLDLPGTEFDVRNTPNDWIAIAGHYLNKEVRKGPNKPTQESFEESLIDAASVILAALEHCEKMSLSHAFVDVHERSPKYSLSGLLNIRKGD